MEELISTHQHVESPQRELHSSLRHEFGKTFRETRLDILTNPSEIGFVGLGDYGTQSSSTAKEGNTGFLESENFMLKSEPQLEFISNKDAPAMGRFSPFKTINYKEDDVQSLQFEPNSPCLFQDKLEIQSKENYFYPHHLSLEQPNFKTFAEIRENQNYFDDCDDEPLDVIWGGSPFPQKIKSLNTQTKMAKDLKLNFDEDSDYDNEDSNSDYKIKNHSPYSKLEEDLGKMFVKKTPSAKSNYSDLIPGHYESTLDTQPVLSQNALFPAAMTRMRPEAYYDYMEMEDPYGEVKGRSSRGLRALSLRVKDVVAMKEKTSYKDVADFLTTEVAQRLKADGQGEARDEQNVKRRVYDALNVLIAADILKKEGKVVSCGDNVDNIGIFKKRRLLIDLERMKRKQFVIQKKIKAKQKALQESMFKFLAIQNLVKRNKEKHTVLPNEEYNAATEEKRSESEDKDASHKVLVDADKTIHFPFILVPSVAPSTMNLHLNKSKTNALVESKLPLNIFGDTDVLLKLKFHYVQKELFDQVIVPDIHKYVPSVYLESLK